MEKLTKENSNNSRDRRRIIKWRNRNIIIISSSWSKRKIKRRRRLIKGTVRAVFLATSYDTININ